MNPLDLIFFRGADIVSKMILKIEEMSVNESEFSHVGIVINKELLNLEPLLEGKLYLLESTVNYNTDQVAGRQIGVQIRELDPVIKNYKSDPDCRVAWCELRDNPFLIDKTGTINTFKKFYTDYGQSFYNMNILDLFAAAWPCLKKKNFFRTSVYNKERIHSNFHNFRCDSSGKWVFCSQLVAEIYRRLGIIEHGISANELMPVEILHLPRMGSRSLL